MDIAQALTLATALTFTSVQLGNCCLAMTGKLKSLPFVASFMVGVTWELFIIFANKCGMHTSPS